MNLTPHRIDDQPIQWEAIEQVDGITICHAVGGQQYITREVMRLRKEWTKYIRESEHFVDWSHFFIRPAGLTHADINLTRHEC